MTDAASPFAASCRFRLPVSGEVVALRQPTGAEELLLLEAAGDDTGLALALASRLARPGGGGGLDWSEMTASDLDALILRLRATVLGDRITADVACQARDCGRRIDLSFGIGEYLAYHRPGKPGIGGVRSVTPDAEPGWFRFDPSRGKDGRAAAGEPTEAVRFRLPVVADQLAVAGMPGAADELARRCIRPPGLSPPLRRRVEAAMEKLAPDLASELRGTCPECAAAVTARFDPRSFCLREWRHRAKFVYQDIDLLARRYRWSETEILTMPQVRRTNYAELARQEGW